MNHLLSSVIINAFLTDESPPLEGVHLQYCLSCLQLRDIEALSPDYLGLIHSLAVYSGQAGWLYERILQSCDKDPRQVLR
jgi:hypothetical protein